MRNVYKFRIGTVFGLLLFALTGYQSLAQVGSYSMTPLSGTFNEVVGGTATSLTATADDALSASFPIGFDFQFGGATYTSVRVNSNGLLTFNATGTTTGANNLATTTANARPGIAPLWDDLQCTSGVTYQVSGTAPNRTLTVQWLNMEWNWGANVPVISFQVILYETSNAIDFVYRQETAAGNPTGSSGASIGLMGTSSTDYLSLQNSSAAPTTSNSASTNNIGTKPATGQIYRFNVPPADPATPVQLGGIPTCSLGAQLGFTTLSESCSSSATASGTDNAGVTATVTDFSCPPSAVTSATLDASIGPDCEAGWYSYSIVVNGTTVASNQCDITGFDLTPYLPLTSVSIISQDDDAFGDGVTMNLTVNLNYEVPFSFPADVVYYWQDSPAGTSLATPHVDPYYVFANGTYYVRAYNTSTSIWSTGSSSVTVSNFPLAAAPPVPVADVNPSCAPDGSSLSVDAPPADVEYYWQGTTADGTSNALPATSPYEYTTSGTYHVSAYDVVSQCWSASSSVTVTVDEVIPPAPVADPEFFNFCSGVVSAPISVNTPVSEPGTCSVNATASGTDNAGVTATVNDFSCAGSNGILSATLDASIGEDCEIGWYSYSIIVNGSTVATAQCDQTGFDLTPFLPLTSVSIVSQDDDAFGDPVTMNLSVNLTFEGPVYSISWHDASTAGTLIGTGEDLEAVGTTVLPAATLGSYDFFAETILGGCTSSTRTVVVVNVTDVNAELIPVDVTCNGGENGSFTLGAVQCGVEPFSYSIDGGAFDPAIPTNLTAGTYSVVIEDDNGLTSAPITVIVAEPAVPSDITVSNINYFSADVAWTTTGDETSWTIEYGPAGFTPGTGTVETASASPYTLTGLTEDTEYDVYITADCGAGAQAGGPATFSTNPGFFTYNSDCGPGFVDISTSGTALNLTDDGTTIVTSGFPLSYQGITTDQVEVSNNGWIQIGGFGGVRMNVWSNDWDSETGNVYHETFNDGTTNWFIVQWDDRPRFPGVAGQSVTFQVLVNETTGEVFYIYDDVVVGGSQASNDFGGLGTISFQGPLETQTVSDANTAYLTNNSCVRWYFALCPDPILVSNQIFQEEAILDWDAGLYGETEWTVIYGEAGFDPATEGTTLTGLTTSDANIIGLTQVTDYDVYIYAECQLDDLTSPGLLVSFQTLPWCNNVTGITASTAVDSLFTAWDWTEVPGATNGGLTAFNLQYGPTGFDLYSEGTILTADGINFADTVFNTEFLAGGVYQVYVQAVCGADTSIYSGPITFVMPLSNDSVCGAEMLMVDGTVYYFNNVGATVETDEALIIPTGGNPAGYNTTELPTTTWGVPVGEGTTWFTFEAPASGSMRFSGLDQNQFASQIAIYQTAACDDFNEFELVAASDQVTPDGSTKIAPNFTICGLTPGATYYVMHDAWSNGFGGAPIFGQYSIKMTPIVLNAGATTDLINVCSGSSVDLFDGITGYDNDGVWSAELPSAETQLNGSEWNSAGFAYEIFNFEYRLTDGCAFDTTFANVRVWAPSNAGSDGTLTVCRNQPFDLLSGLNGTVDLGGTWLNPSLQELESSAIVASNIPGQFNYYYVAGNGICPNDTSLVLVNVQSTCDYLDVQEMYFGSIEIMPNPSNGVFNISNFGSTEVFNYEVSDVDGRIILTKDAAINGTETTTVDLTEKVTGMYMIRVYNDDAEKVFRVIKQ